MIFEDIIFNYNNDAMGYDKTNLYDANTGFLMGNMFQDEYIGYKNYQVSKLVPTNEKGVLLLQIYALDFAMLDLSLYLDLYPDKKEVFEKFKEYSNRLNQLMMEYERRYGPLELNEANYDSYLWYKGKWPFEGVEI